MAHIHIPRLHPPHLSQAWGDCLWLGAALAVMAAAVVVVQFVFSLF